MLSPFEQSKLGHAINRFTAFLENPIFYAMMSVFIRLLEIEKCSWTLCVYDIIITILENLLNMFIIREESFESSYQDEQPKRQFIVKFV